MSWWLLLIFVTLVWVIGAFVDGLIQDCGVVPLPFVLIGVFFWALAMAIDLFASPWGTNIVAGFHALIAAWMAVGFAVFIWRRRR